MLIDVSCHNTTMSIMHLKGRLDMLSSDQLRLAVQAQLSAGRQQIIIDLGGVNFIDSSGLGSMIGCLKAARHIGGELRIARPGKEARSLLHLTNLDLILNPHATVEEAIQAFSKPM